MSIQRAKDLLARLESGTEGVYLVPVKDILASYIGAAEALEAFYDACDLVPGEDDHGRAYPENMEPGMTITVEIPGAMVASARTALAEFERLFPDV